MDLYEKYVSRLLDIFPSEGVHVAARELLHVLEHVPGGLSLVERWFTAQGERVVDPRLNVKIGDLVFENPMGLAAGWTQGHACMGLWALGLAFVTAGGFVGEPQPGNKKPRQFTKRNERGGIVALNRRGFPQKKTLDHIVGDLLHYVRAPVVVGANVGLHKEVPHDEAPVAYARVVAQLYDYVDYFEINVSSPNTAGLRKLQGKILLKAILAFIIVVMNRKGGIKPTFVKVSPDLSMGDLDGVIEAVAEYGLAGIIASNSTTNRFIKERFEWGGEEGGFSGDDSQFREMSNDQIRHIYKVTNGQLIVGGSGGVMNMETALEKIKAGASFIEIITAFRGRGFSLPTEINGELLKYMVREGVRNITELVGIAA